MRLWIAGLLTAGVLLGQAPTISAAPRSAGKPKPAAMAYVCATCGVGAARSTACPLCKKGMGKLATYACLKCQISAYHTAPCPNCREPMESVAKQYRECARCGSFIKRTAKACSVCVKKAHRRR
jgi:hypothetical protein